MMQLSGRLATLVECVRPDTIIADIGTDHAYVPVYLVEKGICPKAIAGDLNAGPVESAMNTVESYGLETKIEVRQGNGLQILSPGEVDMIIIAGMGGLLIEQILSEGKDKLQNVNSLLLQPNNHAFEVRSWLMGSGWGIVDERLVLERGKFYPVIICEQNRGIVTEDPVALEIGPRLLEKGGPLVERFLEKRSRECAGILDGLSRSTNPLKVEKQQRITKLLRGIKEELIRVRKS